MENISDFYPMIINCVGQAVRIVIGIVFSLIVIPWVKNSAIPWLKDRRLYGIIGKFVRAAEKLAESGAISKEAKLDYVLGLLQHSGIEVTPEVRAMIESAVGDLDDEFMYNLSNVAGLFEDEEKPDADEEARDVEPVDDEEAIPGEAEQDDGSV